MKPVYHWLQSLTELGYLNSQQKCEFSKKVSKMTSYIYKKFTPIVSMEFYGLKKIYLWNISEGSRTYILAFKGPWPFLTSMVPSH